MKRKLKQNNLKCRCVVHTCAKEKRKADFINFLLTNVYGDQTVDESIVRR